MSAESIAVPVPPDEALQRLVLGNERFCRGEAHWSGTRPDSLAALAAGQRPFATILGCSDSRVPPELVFDTGLGDLFVVRVAGNVFSNEVAGSIQYAGAHLHTRLFVVLGHDGCGAVAAALETMIRGTRHRSRIHILVENILPALGASTGGSRHPRSWPWRWSATCGGRCGKSPSRRKDGHALQRGKLRWSGACTRWPRGGCGCSRTRSRRLGAEG